MGHCRRSGILIPTAPHSPRSIGHGFLVYFLLPIHTTGKGIGTSATLALDGVVDWVKGSGFWSSRRLPLSNQNPNVVKFSRTRTYNLDTKTCLSDLPRSIVVALLSNHFRHCVIKMIVILMLHSKRPAIWPVANSTRAATVDSSEGALQ